MIIIGERYRNALREPLSAFSDDILWLPDNPDVDPALAGHADLSALAEGERVWLAPYLKDTAVPEALERAGLAAVFPEMVQSPVYPGDAGLNVCRAGHRLICSPRIACPALVRHLTEDRGYRLVSVRQGYAGCCALPAGEEGLITADPGIAAAAEADGMDVLRITPGFVALEGFPWGFLGGAALRPAPGCTAFAGSLDSHPDGERIAAFLRRHGSEPVCLTEGPLRDIGGAAVTGA